MITKFLTVRSRRCNIAVALAIIPAYKRYTTYQGIYSKQVSTAFAHAILLSGGRRQKKCSKFYTKQVYAHDSQIQVSHIGKIIILRVESTSARVEARRELTLINKIQRIIAAPLRPSVIAIGDKSTLSSRPLQLCVCV